MMHRLTERVVLYDPQVPLNHCCTNMFVALDDKCNLSGNSLRAEINEE